MIHESGICFQIQRFSIHDGPGIRTTVFLKGCPLSCSWCHNPEGRSGRPEIHLLEERCIRCGACVEVCPEPGAEAAPAKCIRCGLCAEVCPTEARRLVGRAYRVDELMEEVERDRPFYEESGGGVTFSGGEPLLQGEFLLACLDACRARGLHAAVDTCGFAPADLVREVGRRARLILYDLKSLDTRMHEEATGVPLAPILENLVLLDAEDVEVWIRMPVLPGLNTDDEAIDALGGFLARTHRCRRVHLLPYHAHGAAKYARASVPAPTGFAVPTEDQMTHVAERLARFGLDVRRGG